MPSVFELLKSGGPVMWPLLICSLCAVAYAFERALALRETRLGTETLGRRVVDAARAGGSSGARAVLAQDTSALSKILGHAISLELARPDEREKRVEDFATNEVKRLSWNLKPLLLVYLVAPLFGLLGTVWGLILCFATIARQSGLGRSDLLATGVYQALVTTAAGLAIAIPTLVVYTHFKNKLERFSRRTEGIYRDLDLALAAPRPALEA
jgi:biopolymer transport protein ExbB